MRAVPVILLVEDNPADVKITERALREGAMTAELVVARDGEEALDYLLRHGRHATDSAWRGPDLVLLDLNLPRLNGQQVLERIRAVPALRALPVVMLTTSNRPEEVQQAYAAGANSYLAKPQDYGRFVEVLRLLQRYWLDTVLRPAPPGL